MAKHILVKRGYREFYRWLVLLLKHPVFLFVTIWGHSAIILGAWVYHRFERPTEDFFSSYYWAMATAVTVGASDMSPHTIEGKLASLFVMISGSLFLWSYTALFAYTLMSSTMEDWEKDLEKEIRMDKKDLHRLLLELRKQQSEER